MPHAQKSKKSNETPSIKFQQTGNGGQQIDKLEGGFHINNYFMFPLKAIKFVFFSALVMNLILISLVAYISDINVFDAVYQHSISLISSFVGWILFFILFYQFYAYIFKKTNIPFLVEAYEKQQF